MLEALAKLLSGFGEDSHPSRFDDGDYRLAAAALLIHAAAIDGVMTEAERDRLHAVIKQRFSLDDDSTHELIGKAEKAENEAIDLYAFTARLNRSLDQAGRARMVEMMWQVAFADGAVTEFEDNLIWRAADLLGISREERIALRQRVAGSRPDDGSDGDRDDTQSSTQDGA